MAIVKGANAVQLVRKEYRYDSQQEVNLLEEEYHGSTASAIGLYTKLAGGARNVSVQLDNGIGRVVTQTPVSISKTQDVYSERYELVTEFVEKEIWQIPAVAQEARRYDSTVDATGEPEAPYYRELAETCAASKTDVLDASQYPLFAKVIRYIRDAVNGYELEYIVIRRSRRVPRGIRRLVSAGDGLFYYTTSQLVLPDDVFFSVPDTTSLTPISADYAWGWRRRPSQSVIDGLYVEQSSEFILSQWSTIAYSPSTQDASW